MPALVIIIDEYAELAEQAPEAMAHTDSLARTGRAVAVTMVAATQRPTQKAMGQGAVRSQMDLRICFRVREQRDVDLVLGQGMLKAGWNAHKLDAPGKFLISAPEHDIPRRARAYLVTDGMVSATSARHTQIRPDLDQVSRNAMLTADTPTSEYAALDEYRADDADDSTAEVPATPRTRSGSRYAPRPTRDGKSANSCALPEWHARPCTATYGNSPNRVTPTR
jgi:S-DNA-T family DNA segregation ATPase FtsK/SpoIIIE